MSTTHRPSWAIGSQAYTDYVAASERCAAAFATEEPHMGISHTTVTRERHTRRGTRTTTYHLTVLTGATVKTATAFLGGQKIVLAVDGREFTAVYGFRDIDADQRAVAVGDTVDVQLDEPADDEGQIYDVFNQSLIRY